MISLEIDCEKFNELSNVKLIPLISTMHACMYASLIKIHYFSDS